MDASQQANSGFSGHVLEQLRDAANPVPPARGRGGGRGQNLRGRGFPQSQMAYRDQIVPQYRIDHRPHNHGNPQVWAGSLVENPTDTNSVPPLGNSCPQQGSSFQRQQQNMPAQFPPPSQSQRRYQVPPNQHGMPQHPYQSLPQPRQEFFIRGHSGPHRGRGQLHNLEGQRHTQASAPIQMYHPNDYQRPAPAQRRLFTPGSQPQFNSVEEQRAFQRHIIDQSDFLNHLANQSLKNQITTEEQQEKENFRRELETIAQNVVTKACGDKVKLNAARVQLKLYGSLGSGFGVAGSDMDLLLTFPPNEDLGDVEIESRRMLERALLDVGIGARLLTNTRVPILRVCQKPSSELLQNLREHRLKWEQALTDNEPPLADEGFGPLPLLTESQTTTAANAFADLDLTAHEVPLPASPQPEQAKLEYVGDCGTQCDINFSNYVALHNTKLLKTYGRCDPRVRQLGVFVKCWAKARDINTPYRGTLSSYGYILMVLHYLMNVVNPPIIPNLQDLAKQNDTWEETQNVELVEGFDVRFVHDIDEVLSILQQMPRNHESVGSLLRGFFWYYTDPRGFHWTQDVISIRSRNGPLKKKAKGWTEAKWSDQKSNVRLRYLLAIEDPFELEHNVGRTVGHSGIVAIREEFRRAWAIVDNIQFDKDSRLWYWVNPDGNRLAGEQLMAATEKRGDLLRKDHELHKQKVRKMREELEAREKALQQAAAEREGAESVEGIVTNGTFAIQRQSTAPSKGPLADDSSSPRINIDVIQEKTNQRMCPKDRAMHDGSQEVIVADESGTERIAQRDVSVEGPTRFQGPAWSAAWSDGEWKDLNKGTKSEVKGAFIHTAQAKGSKGISWDAPFNENGTPEKPEQISRSPSEVRVGANETIENEPDQEKLTSDKAIKRNAPCITGETSVNCESTITRAMTTNDKHAQLNGHSIGKTNEGISQLKKPITIDETITCNSLPNEHMMKSSTEGTMPAKNGERTMGMDEHIPWNAREEVVEEQQVRPVKVIDWTKPFSDNELVGNAECSIFATNDKRLESSEDQELSQQQPVIRDNAIHWNGTFSEHEISATTEWAASINGGENLESRPDQESVQKPPVLPLTNVDWNGSLDKIGMSAAAEWAAGAADEVEVSGTEEQRQPEDDHQSAQEAPVLPPNEEAWQDNQEALQEESDMHVKAMDWESSPNDNEISSDGQRTVSSATEQSMPLNGGPNQEDEYRDPKCEYHVLMKDKQIQENQEIPHKIEQEAMWNQPQAATTKAIDWNEPFKENEISISNGWTMPSATERSFSMNGAHVQIDNNNTPKHEQSIPEAVTQTNAIPRQLHRTEQDTTQIQPQAATTKVIDWNKPFNESEISIHASWVSSTTPVTNTETNRDGIVNSPRHEPTIQFVMSKADQETISQQQHKSVEVVDRSTPLDMNESSADADWEVHLRSRAAGEAISPNRNSRSMKHMNRSQARTDMTANVHEPKSDDSYSDTIADVEIPWDMHSVGGRWLRWRDNKIRAGVWTGAVNPTHQRLDEQFPYDPNMTMAELARKNKILMSSYLRTCEPEQPVERQEISKVITRSGHPRRTIPNARLRVETSPPSSHVEPTSTTPRISEAARSQTSTSCDKPHPRKRTKTKNPRRDNHGNTKDPSLEVNQPTRPRVSKPSTKPNKPTPEPPLAKSTPLTAEARNLLTLFHQQKQPTPSRPNHKPSPKPSTSIPAKHSFNLDARQLADLETIRLGGNGCARSGDVEVSVRNSRPPQAWYMNEDREVVVWDPKGELPGCV